MRKLALAFIIGAVVGVPLTVLFGPVGSFITIFLVSFVISASTGTTQKTTKTQPKRPLSKDDEELITAILPVINHK